MIIDSTQYDVEHIISSVEEAFALQEASNFVEIVD